MTEKEVHEFAKQADLCWTNGQPMIEIHLLERFAALVAAHEREACSQIAARWDDDVETRTKPSDAIRARGDA